jgi:hypothetical protein
VVFRCACRHSTNRQGAMDKRGGVATRKRSGASHLPSEPCTPPLKGVAAVWYRSLYLPMHKAAITSSRGGQRNGASHLPSESCTLPFGNFIWDLSTSASSCLRRAYDTTAVCCCTDSLHLFYWLLEACMRYKLQSAPVAAVQFVSYVCIKQPQAEVVDSRW